MADGQGSALGSGSIPWCSASFIIRFSPFEESLLNCGGFSYTQNRKEVSLMAKGKYEYWLTPDGLLKLEAWARDGLTDKQISHNIGITEQTLNIWKRSYPSFFESLKRGKEVVDIEVENALLKRALGYEYTETKTEEYIVEGVPVKRVTKTVKEVIPDTTAQIFWLKNRRPMQWRDKHDMELSGEVKAVNPYAGLTTEELRKLIHGG